jgi:ABC-type dipeptide/oligopeptide/nickel transport system permease component
MASYQALQQKDIPLLMGCVITGSVFILLLNLITDVVRTKVDPRVSL